MTKRQAELYIQQIPLSKEDLANLEYVVDEEWERRKMETIRRVQERYRKAGMTPPVIRKG